MDENNNDDWQDVPVTVEEVSPDSEEANQTIDSTDTENVLPDEEQEKLSENNELSSGDSLEDSENLTTETVETLPEDTVTLQQIHYDLLIVIFLLLFFWLYERIKVGLRNFRKTTK